MKELGVVLVACGIVLAVFGIFNVVDVVGDAKGWVNLWLVVMLGVLFGLIGVICAGWAKPRTIKALVLAVFIVLLVMALPLISGCAAPHTRLVEMPRSAVVNNPQVRSSAPWLFSNRYSATNADIRIYEGQLQKSDMIGNVGGQPVIFSDYAAKFSLTNAFGSNDPTVIKVMLDPGKRYTALVVINWGAFGKIYDIYSVSLFPNTDALQTVWTSPRGWDSAYVNGYVEVNGSNEPAYSRLDLTWTVYPNEIFRRALVGGIR